MFKTLIILIISITYSFANVQSGDEIKAVEYNNSKFTIGDIKTSILTLAEFQTLHGSCWIKLNQGADNSNVDITGSDLATLKSINSIKSATGRVLRAEGGLSDSLGNTQEDSFQSHQHDTVEGVFSGGSGASRGRRLTVTNIGEVSAYSQSSNALRTNSVIDGGSGTPRVSSETRMKNLTVNMFIKVNHECN